MTEIAIATLLIIVGSLILTAGATLFVEGASKIALLLNISPLIIGITIVALGTSLPEFFVSFIAAIKNKPSISIGNIVGSNICNISFVLGLAALLGSIKVNKNILKLEYPFLVFASIFLVISSINGTIGRIEGTVMIITLLALINIYYRKERTEDYIKKQNISTLKSIIYLVFGLIMLISGSEMFIRSATKLARIMGISELVIGLTVVAIGTSLPEIATTIVAAVKGKSDIAVGNVIGSNLMNILFIVGTTSVITPIKTDKQLFKLDFPTMLLFTFILFPFIKSPQKFKINKPIALLLITGYFIYIGLLYKNSYAP